MLRPATAADLPLLRHWHRQPHVVAAVGDDWGWEAELARSPDWREQLIAELDGRPIGFVQIVDPARDDSQFWGGVAAGHRAIEIWIGEIADLGLGFGTAMMKQSIAKSFADSSVSTLLVDPLECNERAHRFCERLGFEYVVRRCFGDDRCFVYRLTRPNARLETPERRV
ncbi:MAG: GNAT family N-acetyltransferase [Steroidobacteraceae bacterium]